MLVSAIALAGDEPASREPDAIARLRIEPADGEYLAWADNTLAGPIEVMLRATAGSPLPSDPPLPARASVPAASSVLLARLRTTSGRSANFPLSLSGVPGSSNARPRDIEYQSPLRQADTRIDQGFEGSFSHVDAENRYALDFAVEPGTPVSAARAGTVMQVEDGFRASGLAYGEYAKRANIIRILHDDAVRPPRPRRRAGAAGPAGAGRPADRPVRQYRLQHGAAPAFRRAGESRHAPGLDPVPHARRGRSPMIAG